MSKKGKIANALTFANTVIEQAKEELRNNKMKDLKEKAKKYLEEIQSMKRSLDLAERNYQSFIKELQSYDL